MSRTLQYQAGVGILLVLAILAYLPLHQLIQDGLFPNTHEGARYPVLAEHFYQAFSSGVFYPRWLPELNGGYGYPTFVFYQPGFFYLHLPFRFLIDDPLAAFYATLYLLLLIGAAGAYRLGRKVSGHCQGGLFAASMFVLTPYAYVNLYVRGDLSELLAMMLVPWCLAFMVQLWQVTKRHQGDVCSVVGVAVSTAAVIYSHPAAALIFALALTLFALLLTAFAHDSRQKYLFFVSSLVAGCVALALSSPYWLGVFLMQEHVNLHAATGGMFEPRLHAVYWQQFFDFSWSHGASTPGDDDTISFQLGAMHFVVAVTGALVGWAQRIVRVAFGLYMLLILSMTPFFVGFWQLPILEFVQFPWRVLAVVGGFQLLCLAALFSSAGRGIGVKMQRGLLLGAVLFVLLSAVLYRAQFVPQGEPINTSYEHIANMIRAEKKAFVTYALTDEFRPETAQPRPMPRPRMSAGELIVAAPGVRVEVLDGHNAHSIRYRLTSPEASQFILLQLYFPGWVVVVDGKTLSDDVLRASVDPRGFMRFSLAPGEHTVQAWYGGLPNGGVRVVLAFLLSVTALWGYRRFVGRFLS